jgi:beta-lactamase regulating signal transducer with metallopeptidase domain
LPVVFTSTLHVAAARVDRTPNVGEIALFVWALGAGLVALPLLVSAAQLRRVVQKSRAVESACPVPIRTSPHIAGPLVAGLLRPVILLPDSAALWERSAGAPFSPMNWRTFAAAIR